MLTEKLLSFKVNFLFMYFNNIYTFPFFHVSDPIRWIIYDTVSTIIDLYQQLLSYLAGNQPKIYSLQNIYLFNLKFVVQLLL